MNLYVLCADYKGFQNWATRHFPNLRGLKLQHNRVIPIYDRECCNKVDGYERNQLVVELADFQRLPTSERQWIQSYLRYREAVPVILP